MKSAFALTISTGLLLTAPVVAYDPSHTEPGPKGEPGSRLKQVYSKQFRVADADYFSALNEFYSFARARRFMIDFGDCFREIIDIKPSPPNFPCIGVYGAKGAPTKAHMTFTVLSRSFFRHDGHDFLTYRIDIYIDSAYKYEPVHLFAQEFQASATGKLEELDGRVAAATGEMP